MARTYKDTKQFKLKGFGHIGSASFATWKKMKKKSRRTKEKEAIRNNKEVPIFKKTDLWDYL